MSMDYQWKVRKYPHVSSDVFFSYLNCLRNLKNWLDESSSFFGARLVGSNVTALRKTKRWRQPRKPHGRLFRSSWGEGDPHLNLFWTYILHVLAIFWHAFDMLVCGLLVMIGHYVWHVWVILWPCWHFVVIGGQVLGQLGGALGTIETYF